MIGQIPEILQWKWLFLLNRLFEKGHFLIIDIQDLGNLFFRILKIRYIIP